MSSASTALSSFLPYTLHGLGMATKGTQYLAALGYFNLDPSYTQSRLSHLQHYCTKPGSPYFTRFGIVQIKTSFHRYFFSFPTKLKNIKCLNVTYLYGTRNPLGSQPTLMPLLHPSTSFRLRRLLHKIRLTLFYTLAGRSIAAALSSAWTVIRIFLHVSLNDPRHREGNGGIAISNFTAVPPW